MFFINLYFQPSGDIEFADDQAEEEDISVQDNEEEFDINLTGGESYSEYMSDTEVVTKTSVKEEIGKWIPVLFPFVNHAFRSLILYVHFRRFRRIHRRRSRRTGVLRQRKFLQLGRQRILRRRGVRIESIQIRRAEGC